MFSIECRAVRVLVALPSVFVYHSDFVGVLKVYAQESCLSDGSEYGESMFVLTSRGETASYWNCCLL